MPVALGWLSPVTAPFCSLVPFGPVNSVAHNGLLILFERVGGKTTPVYKSVVSLDQTEQQLPDSLLLFSSRLPQTAVAGPASVSLGQLKAQGRSHHQRFHSSPVWQQVTLTVPISPRVSRSRSALLQHRGSVSSPAAALPTPAGTCGFGLSRPWSCPPSR